MSEYSKNRKPAKEFFSRQEYLENELKTMNPKRWKLNLPGRDFRFEFEDLVPAISGTIGKIVMVTAIVSAFAAGFGLTPEFVVENVRFELLLVAILFVIPISGFFNPRANLPGTHGPLIPLIGLIVLAGGHPLALGLMIGLFGLILGLAKGGSRLVNLTGNSVRAGLLIILGMLGLIGQMNSFRTWANGIGMESVFLVVIAATIIIYALLARIGKRWLAIPLGTGLAIVIALIMGAPFSFETSPGIPNLNPMYWWGEDTGWKIGLPNLEHFIAVIPFAALAIAMWPPDFLGHRVFQEMNYPKGSEKTLMHVDDTMISCSVRQAVGSVLGGGNITSSWGTFMIPSGIAKRPIPAGAILTGVLCIVAVLVGYPMDLAIWEPALRVALIVGVFLPLLEAGMAMVKTTKDAEGAGICIISSVLVNPVFGWTLAMLLDNLGIFDKERARALPTIDRVIIPAVTFVVITVFLVLAGLIPGIPAML
ncbi:MAG TPA: hypothetical protein DCM62_03375 [Bacteroidales bacterium]|nr:hypothetical protein [Bacteroidales bacterium]